MCSKCKFATLAYLIYVKMHSPAIKRIEKIVTIDCRLAAECSRIHRPACERIRALIGNSKIFFSRRLMYSRLIIKVFKMTRLSKDSSCRRGTFSWTKLPIASLTNAFVSCLETNSRHIDQLLIAVDRSSIRRFLTV